MRRLIRAVMVVSVLAGTAAVAPPAANAVVTCGKFATLAIQNGRYNVQNNVWGADTTQCVDTTASGFTVTQANHNKPTNGAPAAYPSVYFGCHFGNCTSGSGLPLQANTGTFAGLRSAVSMTYPGAGTWNGAYDLWFDPTPRTNGQNTGAEIMIWLNHQGSIQPIGSRVGSVSLAGSTWDVWFGNVGWNVVSYVRTSATTSLSFAVNDFYSDAVNRGHAQRSWWLTSIQAGFEPWIGGAGLAVNSFSVSTGASPPPSPPPLPERAGVLAVPPTPQAAGTVVTGLASPWGLAFLPDGSALVSERNSAQVKRIANGTVTTVGTVPGVAPAGEGGLHGLAVSPSFATDRFVYAYFTAANDNRVVRMPFTTTLGQPQVLVSGIPKAQIHNGGRLAFGPDGLLYISTGDAGQSANSQNPSSLGGKILRVTATGAAAPGNPTAGNRMWSMGHRNVQGLAFDGGGRLWASEFGQNTWDELNLVQAGRNYGWPTVEGMAGNPNFADPIAQWSPGQASPSGIAFSRNTVWLASLRGQRLWAVPVLNGSPDGSPVSFFNGTFGRLRLVTNAPDGSMWLMTNNTDGRGTPRPGDDQIQRLTFGGTQPAPPPPATGACQVTYVPNSWQNGFTATVTIANTEPAPVDGWTLTWTFPGDQRVVSAWNATLTQDGSSVTARNAGHNAAISPNGTQSFGFQGTYSGTNSAPTGFTLNGGACAA